MKYPYDERETGRRFVRAGLGCGTAAAIIVVAQFVQLAIGGGSRDIVTVIVGGFFGGMSAILAILGFILIGYGTFRGAPRRPALIGFVLCWLVLTGLLGFILAT